MVLLGTCTFRAGSRLEKEPLMIDLVYLGMEETNA